MSITEIAKNAGVSPSTVSRVINNKPGIAESTRTLVFSAMDKVGYVPKAAHSRPGRKTNGVNMPKLSNVAFISFARYRSQLQSPVYAEIIHGVEEELAKADMNMMFKQMREDNDISEWFSNRELDGIILFSPEGKLGDWVRLNHKTVPVVSILGWQSGFGWCDKISYNNPAVAELAMDYLLSRGHRKLLILDSDRHTQRLRELAEKNGIEAASISSEDGFYITNEQENRPNQAVLYEKFDEYLAGNDLPSAIFLPADAFAVPVYSLLMQKGYTAGKDFEVVSVNNEASLLDGLHPRPATVDIQSYEMGRAAVQRLLWRKEHPDEPRLTLTIDPMLIEPEPVL